MRSTVTRTARNHHSLGAAIFNLLGLFLPGPFVACVDAGRIGHSLYEHTAAKPRSAAVQQYHPLGKVPVLIETLASSCKDDAKGSEEAFYLYESAAIVTYLGDWYTTSTTTTTIHVKDGNKEDPCALLVPPAGTRLRARYDQTISFIITELDSQGLWVYDKHAAMGNVFGLMPDAVAVAKAHLTRSNAALAQQIRQNGNEECIAWFGVAASDGTRRIARPMQPFWPPITSAARHDRPLYASWLCENKKARHLPMLPSAWGKFCIST